MFLEKIAGATKIRVENRKNVVSFEEIKRTAENLIISNNFPFERALEGEEISFICEVKKASPSKGIIAEDFPYLNISREYEQAGAAAISVLTEPEYFKGADEYLAQISKEVKTPTLRKDFIIDPYQIYEAKTLGAAAVLFISELLSKEEIKEFIKIADSLYLSALVESHSLKEMEKAIDAGARVIGVNNRNLHTFDVDLQTSIRLREHAPKDRIFVSESGIATAKDISELRQNGVNAVLIGETLMRSQDKKKKLDELRGES